MDERCEGDGWEMWGRWVRDVRDMGERCECVRDVKEMSERCEGDGWEMWGRWVRDVRENMVRDLGRLVRDVKESPSDRFDKHGLLQCSCEQSRVNWRSSSPHQHVREHWVSYIYRDSEWPRWVSGSRSEKISEPELVWSKHLGIGVTYLHLNTTTGQIWEL